MWKIFKAFEERRMRRLKPLGIPKPGAGSRRIAIAPTHLVLSHPLCNDCKKSHLFSKHPEPAQLPQQGGIPGMSPPPTATRTLQSRGHFADFYPAERILGKGEGQEAARILFSRLYVFPASSSAPRQSTSLQSMKPCG